MKQYKQDNMNTNIKTHKKSAVLKKFNHTHNIRQIGVTKYNKWSSEKQENTVKHYTKNSLKKRKIYTNDIIKIKYKSYGNMVPTYTVGNK